jgi:hypothetical protein
MAYIGLKHPVFAPIATEPANSLPTYGTGFVVGKAILANLSKELSDSVLPADDGIAEVDNSFIKGTITLGVDDLSDDVLKGFLGYRDASLGGRATIRAASTYEAPNGGFGYYRVRKKNGVRTIRAYWYHKTKWGMPSEEAATKPDGSIEWQTPELEGTVMPLQDEDITWQDIVTFDNEMDAIAWLDGLANVPISESTGLSGLELTGTGGTLSPAFDAGVRYYTFDGVSAAAVTVKATAADHTLRLYIDGVFSQNLTSGEASDSISVALGSKKLTITAQELGKTVQTTEIIVVKTA